MNDAHQKRIEKLEQEVNSVTRELDRTRNTCIQTHIVKNSKLQQGKNKKELLEEIATCKNENSFLKIEIEEMKKNFDEYKSKPYCHQKIIRTEFNNEFVCYDNFRDQWNGQK